MIKAVQISQEWPVSSDRTKISPAVVRSHLLANPQGMTISDIADRTGLVQYAGDTRRSTDSYLVAVWRVLSDLEDIGVAVEIGERWFDAIQVQRDSMKRRRDLRRACEHIDAALEILDEIKPKLPLVPDFAL